MTQQRLETALLRAGLSSAALAAAVGVDVKTVNRWLAGRVPHRRTRHQVADALDEAEESLWPIARPDTQPGAPATAEVLGAYAHRAEIPNHLWISMVHRATERIDIIGYAFPFVFELLPKAAELVADKANSGCVVRLGFADPDCEHVMERDSLEQMGGTLPGRIRNALSMLGPLADTPGCSVGLHTTHLYNSVFRFDSEMIVTPYLFRARGYQHTALYLRRLSPYGIFESFADQFEQIWGTTTPYVTREGFDHGLEA